MGHAAKVTSTVLFVAELARSVRFYSEVFGCEAAVHAEGGVLLLAPDGFQLYLIAKGRGASHPSEQIGAQYLMWGTETADDLSRFAELLKSHDRYTDTHSSGGVTFVEGTDPDGIRVVIAHPNPQQHPRSVLDSRIYA